MSSEFTSQNIIFTGNLKRPGTALGSILASNSSGVFQLVVPASDGRFLVTDSGRASGISWLPEIWEVSGSIVTPINEDVVTRFVFCDSTNTVDNGWGINGSLLSSINSALRNATSGNTPRPNQGAVIASDNSQLIGSITTSELGSMNQTCIMASKSCIIQRARSDDSFIGGSIDSGIRTNLGSGATNKIIIGCDNCDYNQGRGTLFACRNTGSSNNQGDAFNSYISCDAVSFGRNGDFNTFLSSNNVQFGNHLRCLIKATFADVNHSGTSVFSDDDSTTRLTTTATNSWLSRYIGGETRYSNAALTTGVTLATGASTWAMVSNKYVKENFTIVDSDDILGRVRDLPVYEYNFIGNPKEMKCIGPFAQDWHSIVTPLETYTEIIEDPDDKEKKIEVEKDAKDKLTIEEMDVLGICLASIKSLSEKVGQFSNINELKRKKIKLLESKIERVREIRVR